MLGVERGGFVLILALINAQMAILPSDDIELTDKRIVPHRVRGVHVNRQHTLAILTLSYHALKRLLTIIFPLIYRTYIA